MDVDEKEKHALYSKGARGSVVVEALWYNPEGRGFETRSGNLISCINQILPAAIRPGVYSVYDRNTYQIQKTCLWCVVSRARSARKSDNFTAVCEPIF
jgi:hypothetical protein